MEQEGDSQEIELDPGDVDPRLEGEWEQDYFDEKYGTLAVHCERACGACGQDSSRDPWARWLPDCRNGISFIHAKCQPMWVLLNTYMALRDEDLKKCY